MLNRRQARMAEGGGGLGHLVTPADRLARIAHDPQHVCERQFAGYGCSCRTCSFARLAAPFGAPSARPFSTVSVHRYRAADRNRGPCVSASGSLVLQAAAAAAPRPRFPAACSGLRPTALGRRLIFLSIRAPQSSCSAVQYSRRFPSRLMSASRFGVCSPLRPDARQRGFVDVLGTRHLGARPKATGPRR